MTTIEQKANVFGLVIQFCVVKIVILRKTGEKKNKILI